MENIRLDIEYDGSGFAGWQRQPASPTVQATLEDLLQKLTGTRTIVYGASRTDSGVHARGQVATFFTEYSLPAEKWAPMLNFHLPKSVRIVRSASVPRSFSAQKQAISKIYEYRVLNRATQSALDTRVYFYPRPLDWDAIRRSLPEFVGEKDFKPFQGAKAEVKTTVRTILSFELLEEGDGLHCFRIEGTGFLKQMVRAIMGTVIEVGEKKRRPEDIKAIFLSGDRGKAGRTLPAAGLTLAKIHFREGQ